MSEPPATDPLAELRTQVRGAQLAAERLAREATRAAPSQAPTESAAGAGGSADTDGGGGFAEYGDGADEGRQGPRTPPNGWNAPPPQDAPGELRALADLLESLRAMLPEELRGQLNDLIRQILLLMRAVIDWLVLRMGRETAPPSAGEAIEDIPIS